MSLNISFRKQMYLLKWKVLFCDPTHQIAQDLCFFNKKQMSVTSNLVLANMKSLGISLLGEGTVKVEGQKEWR